LDGIFTNVVLGLEYLLTNNIYLHGGLQFDIPLSSSVTAEREILVPKDFVFQNQSNKQDYGINKLSSLNQVGISGNLGVGFIVNVYRNYIAFFETAYSHRLTNIVDDADWTVSLFGIRAGLRFPL